MRRAAAFGVLALACAGCLPQSATTDGNDVAGLYRIFVAGGIAVFAIVWALLTWSVLRYRATGRSRVTREDARGGMASSPAVGDLPPQTHGNTRLELVWTAIPAVTIAVLFILTLGVLNSTTARSEGATAIQVIGSRWGWTFVYPSGAIVQGSGVPGPEAVVPANEPVRFDVTAIDVVHSFYVPQFLAKYDAIPGHVYPFEVTITEGTYGGQCAEFCGLLHDRMPFTVRAAPRAEYEAWLGQQPVVSPSASRAALPTGDLVSSPGASPAVP